jgi:ribosome-interacting GTPase 1
MPANLTPEYKNAEAEFRKARDSQERLKWLREMLRTIPKHKGTEHLQADIKTRIKQLSEEVSGPRKGAARTGPALTVRPEGAAQISLIGPPNSGKSSLLARATGSQTDIGPYPCTTRFPVPGMLPYEDVNLQLVDLPPISREYMENWYANALQPSDAALLVVDLNDPECVEHVVAIRERLDAKRVTLSEKWPYPLFETVEAGGGAGSAAAGGVVTVAKAGTGGAAANDGTANPDAASQGAASENATGEDDEEVPDPFRVTLPTLLVANKSDLDPDPEEVRILEELAGARYPALAVSAKTGRGLDALAGVLFRGLGIVRIYTKIPGKPADMGTPYTARRGATVLEVATLVHRDIARSLKFARIWGSGQFDGQTVGPDHRVEDRDVLELHA